MIRKSDLGATENGEKRPGFCGDGDEDLRDAV